MDPATEDFIRAEFSKINFVLEALWANVALNHGATPEGIAGLREELLRQFRTLPGTTSDGSPYPANDTGVSELAAERISALFEHVEERVRSAQPQ